VTYYDHFDAQHRTIESNANEPIVPEMIPASQPDAPVAEPNASGLSTSTDLTNVDFDPPGEFSIPVFPQSKLHEQFRLPAPTDPSSTNNPSFVIDPSTGANERFQSMPLSRPVPTEQTVNVDDQLAVSIKFPPIRSSEDTLTTQPSSSDLSDQKAITAKPNNVQISGGATRAMEQISNLIQVPVETESSKWRPIESISEASAPAVDGLVRRLPKTDLDPSSQPNRVATGNSKVIRQPK
jgi:hypothetical protein